MKKQILQLITVPLLKKFETAILDYDRFLKLRLNLTIRFIYFSKTVIWLWKMFLRKFPIFISTI